MSDLPGNPFADAHEETYHQVGQDMVADLGQTEATLIWSAIENHATATLALAYEQRTANLIAVATAVSENGVYQLDPALIGAAQEELATRLGLGATK